MRVVAIVVTVALHLLVAISLYVLMRPRPAADGDRIEVRLLDAPPSEPVLPEPPQESARVPPRMRVPVTLARRPSPAASAPVVAATPDRSTELDTATLFNADGSLRVPVAPPPKSAPHEEAVRRGREMMARGLDCEAHGPDDLAHRESVGEEAARKYLAWIGLYNPAAAQRRAELEEQRQTRCRMWKKEAGP
ncbi:MAG: hypothetical protein QM741_16535 [Rudaea sp.]|uniref:hypothetical protein n=1 Tax=Rudaea sp. TaxID=2136325 RepID=UPI0039E608DC